MFPKLSTFLKLSFALAVCVQPLFINAQEEEDCPVCYCVDEECCGFGSVWSTTFDECVLSDDTSPDISLGFNGSYLPGHVFGCDWRDCCEEECCGEGLNYDRGVNACLPACPYCASLQGTIEDEDGDEGDIPDFDSKTELFEFYEIEPRTEPMIPIHLLAPSQSPEITQILDESSTQCSNDPFDGTDRRSLRGVEGLSSRVAVVDHDRDRHLKAKSGSIKKFINIVKKVDKLSKIVTCCSCSLGTLSIELICIPVSGPGKYYKDIQACLCDMITDPAVNKVWKITCDWCLSPATALGVANKLWGCKAP